MLHTRWLGLGTVPIVGGWRHWTLGPAVLIVLDAPCTEVGRQAGRDWPGAAGDQAKIVSLPDRIATVRESARPAGEDGQAVFHHDDDKFIECALAAGASLIVSGDHHLLDLGEYEDVRVLSAAEFVARFV